MSGSILNLLCLGSNPVGTCRIDWVHNFVCNASQLAPRLFLVGNENGCTKRLVRSRPYLKAHWFTQIVEPQSKKQATSVLSDSKALSVNQFIVLRAGHARLACEVSGATMPPAAGTH